MAPHTRTGELASGGTAVVIADNKKTNINPVTLTQVPVAKTRLAPGSVLDPVPAHPKDSMPADAKNRAVHKDGFFSQEHQEKWMLHNVFNWARNGVFFEAGVRDGIDYSNTYFMEKHLGWTGLVVDANPVLAAGLVKHRDSVLRPKTCLSDNDGDAITFLAYDSGIAGVEGSVEGGRVATQLRERGIDIASIRQTLHCSTLTKLFDDAKIDTVDFFSLDIEGHELKALKGLDLTRICVYSMLIENNHGDKAVENYLAGFGYAKAAHLYIDDLYIRKTPCPRDSDAVAVKTVAAAEAKARASGTAVAGATTRKSYDIDMVIPSSMGSGKTSNAAYDSQRRDRDNGELRYVG